MKFKHGLILYNCVLLLIIFVICVLEWNSLSKYQINYEAKKQEEQQSREEAQKKHEEEASIAEEHRKKDKTIIADGFMKIYINGELITPSLISTKNDTVCDDLTELTGIEANKCTYTISIANVDTLMVKDALDNPLTPIDNNNYISAAYQYNETLAKEALDKFEYYLYFFNGMANLQDMKKITRTESKAYQALVKSTEMLHWSKKSTNLTFDEENVTNMRQYDDNHFICDIQFKMTKTLKNGYTEQEDVHYRILFEKINDNWFIYSYFTI